MSAARASQLRAPRTRQDKPGLALVRRRPRSPLRRAFTTSLAPLVVLASVLVAAAIAGVLLEHIVLTKSAFELSKIREEVTVAEARHQELLLQATKLASPGRIERYARNELGMVDAETAATRYVVAEIKGLGGEFVFARSQQGESLAPATGIAVDAGAPGENP
jgi:cell division protein FtsL